MEIDRIAAMVGVNEKAVILEIGANDGGVSRSLVDVLPKCQIFAFEPDPRAIARFKSKNAHPRICMVEKAIGAGPERKIKFHQSNHVPTDKLDASMPEGWDYSGSIRKPTGHLTIAPWVTFEKTIDIDIVSLDEWASQNCIGEVNFIWADVQGAEIDLIAGGKETLLKTRYFYTEFFDIELYEGSIGLDKIMQELPEFEIQERFSNDVLLRNKLYL